jgi:GDP-mannose 6-dehydrogenase
LESNAAVIERAVTAVLDSSVKRVGMVGLSFKPSTDDLRESPFVELAERLLGKGLCLAIYDPNVSMTKLMGGNKSFIETTIPHLSRLLVYSLEELAQRSDLLIIAHRFVTSDRLKLVLPHNCMVLDLSDLSSQTITSHKEASCYGDIALRAAS